MDTRMVSDFDHWFYDPTIYGFDDEVFKSFSGNSEAVNGKIRITADSTSAGKVNTTSSFLLGKHTFNMTIPSAPSTGDSRIFGFYSTAYGNRNAAYFFISGSTFYARTYGDSATAETTTIAWNSAWTNTATKFEIRMYVEKVEFYINGINVINTVDSETIRKDSHTQYIPGVRLIPMYFYNNQIDNMMISYIESRDVRKIFSSKPGFYTPTSASVSPSSSVSPSDSPSESPSVSPSASDSPSLSPSSSDSPSESPSLSPSSSDSPSESPSLSPSSSDSPSESPSVSPSSSASESA